MVAIIAVFPITFENKIVLPSTEYLKKLYLGSGICILPFVFVLVGQGGGFMHLIVIHYK